MKKKKNNNSNKELTFDSKPIKSNVSINEDYKTMRSFIIVVVIIAVLMLGLFYFNGKFVTKDHFQGSTTTTTKEATFDNTSLTISTMFDITDDEYYVLLYDKNDKSNASIYNGLVADFKDDKIKIYTVDMSSAMNKKYYNKDGKANTSPNKSEDVMITEPTLIVFKKGKVNEYITGIEKIASKLSK